MKQKKTVQMCGGKALFDVKYYIESKQSNKHAAHDHARILSYCRRRSTICCGKTGGFGSKESS